MKENNWYTIWNKKSVVGNDNTGDEFRRFCELKKANGFDEAVENADAYYRIFYKNWIDFFNKALELTGGEISSVYEVGCGSGVNLFMFKNRLHMNRWGGCDYSDSMIQSAVISTGDGDFKCCSANEITEEPKYDLVMSESVFQYFESEEYAEKVLRKMILKSDRLTYLGEINDKQFEEELMEYRRKTISNFEERYKGLNRLFLQRNWIEDVASDYGKKVIFTKADNSEYINGRYIFNCFII